MRSSLHDIWGCAKGQITRLAPETRIAAGAMVFASCMIAPTTATAQLDLVAPAVLVWLLFCRVPPKTLRNVILFALLILAPVFLLVPVMWAGLGGEKVSLWVSLARTWAVFFRGMAGMLVAVSTVCSLTISDLYLGLSRLPIPKMVSSILAQIVHQTATLFYESRCVIDALAVRGATRGIGTGLEVLISLPKVWLPRILSRAERVASAMVVRDYKGELLTIESASRKGADLVVMIAAAGFMCFLILVRWKGLA